MEVALGIAIGVSTVETLMPAGVAFVIVTTAEPDVWRQHRKRTTERLRAWRVNLKNGEDLNEQ